MTPKWLEERRKRAAQREAELPIPTTGEWWRRTNLAKIGIEKFAPTPPAQNGASQGEASRLLPIQQLWGGELLIGERTSPAVLDRHCIQSGVILMPLAQAAQEKEDLVATYLGKGFRERNEKFILQNEGHWQAGAFCYIPKETIVPSPLLIVSSFARAGSALFPRIVLVLDRGAKATVVCCQTSRTNGENTNYSNSVCEAYLEEGADLTWIDLQNLSPNTYEVAAKRAEVGREAHLKWVLNQFGSKLSKADIETVLAGEGAKAEVIGLVRGKERQQLELCSLTHHTTAHTTADIFIKATADDRAKTIFQGMIKIDKPAQQTESYMANHNLVLSEQAHCDSIPRLEIEADDVKASHGATIGQVDPEQMFYLRSKGLPRGVAERLLVTGFYEDVFGRVPLESIRELMRKNLEGV